MKASYTILADFTSYQKPFLIKEIIQPHFSTDFHYHQECQLVYILSGTGTRIIGDSIKQFADGDLTFIGSNVPHVWYSKIANETEQLPDRSIAIYINAAGIIENLRAFIDTKTVEEFFRKSERGICIVGEKNEQILALMQEMLAQKSIAQLGTFLKILELLIDSKEFIWLNKPSFLAEFSNNIQGRVSHLMHFIQNNFKSV